MALRARALATKSSLTEPGGHPPQRKKYLTDMVVIATECMDVLSIGLVKWWIASGFILDDG
jgi:hypothetical protein